MKKGEAAEILIKELEVQETQKIKMIHEIWKIESNMEKIKEKLDKLNYKPIH